MISIVNWDRGQWGWPMMTGEDWKRNPQVGEKILGVAREEVFVHPFQLFQQQPQPVKRYLCPFQQFQQQSYQWTFILQGIAIGDSFLKILSHVTEVGYIIGDISIWIIFCQEMKITFKVSRARIRDSTMSDTGLNHLLGPKVSLVILATMQWLSSVVKCVILVTTKSSLRFRIFSCESSSCAIALPWLFLHCNPLPGMMINWLWEEMINIKW